MDIYKSVWQAGLKSIERRAMSSHELQQKLLRKFPDDQGMILKVIEEMERVHLINDRRYTEQFAEYYIQKAIGRMKIMVEARKRGLDQDLVDQILLNLEWNEEESCKRALEEKKRTLHENDKRKWKQKMVNFLQSRGFRNAVIFGVLTD